MRPQNSLTSYFYQYILFNLCFFLTQLLFIFTQSSSFLSSIKLPHMVYVELGITLLIHIVLYSLLSIFQTILLVGTLKNQWNYFKPEQWQVMIWILSILFIICANSYFFPLSIFSKLFSPLLHPGCLLFLLYSSGILLFILLVNWGLTLNYIHVLGLGIIGIIAMVFLAPWPEFKYSVGGFDKENIIIIGIDSLSPKSADNKNMPFLNKLIEHSVVFSNTISPFARTYPAWTSILTGLYTKNHHAEENLIPEGRVQASQSIAWIMKKKGYNTIYATDDRRFNGIDTLFGFNTVIGPKIGANDVILGSYNDFPLSNLIVNTRIGAKLFPYNYANRASFHTYYPQTFDNLLKNKLKTESHTQSVFLAVHFTLPHWPYAWANSNPKLVNNEYDPKNREVLYQKALGRVDAQVHTLFNFLKKNHYLDNCILIVLSDHGETLYHSNTRLTNYATYKGTGPSKFAQYLKKYTATDIDKSAGHGSDILSPEQYHSLLAFITYKKGIIVSKKGKIDTRVSIIDLAPTILSHAEINVPHSMDGISLNDSLKDPFKNPGPRTFFIESGIFPNQILSKRDAMKIGQLYYEINSTTGKVEIKKRVLNKLMKQKLYGVIKEDWILALYPIKDAYIPIIQNLKTGEWTDDLSTSFANESPAQELYDAMTVFNNTKYLLVH